MPTLAELRTALGRYAGTNESFTDRINQVIERLLPEGNFKGSKVPVRFVVYKDARNNRIVTLPREFENILAGSYQFPSTVDSDAPVGCYGHPLTVQNGWYEFAQSGPGNATGSDARRGIIPLAGRYTTFTDWDTSVRLRIKLEEDESPGGKIIIRGILAGQKIRSVDGSNSIEGVAINYTNATVTTTQRFDRPPYQIIKPKTKGPVYLYTVDDDDVETLAGFYDPYETNPSYKRYKVPACEHA